MQVYIITSCIVANIQNISVALILSSFSSCLDSDGTVVAELGHCLCMLQMIMSLLMDRGDVIMCESYTYPHIIESLVSPRGFQVQGIMTDGEGIIPEALSSALEEHKAPGRAHPRLLYTVPVGQNPTGACFCIYSNAQMSVDGCQCLRCSGVSIFWLVGDCPIRHSRALICSCRLVST